MPEAIRLDLYGRGYCHLCQIMWDALEPLSWELKFVINPVDVDRDPALENRLGEWVPVLMHGDREICHYHLDEPALRAYLSNIS